MLNVNIANISVSVQGSFRDLLSNISFSVPQNSVYTILGKNGSGKSTLIKSFTSLLDSRFYKVKGGVEWKNVNLLNLKSEELLNIRKNEIRYVFQDSLNSLDPLKNVKYYFDNAECKKEKLEELLCEFQLPDYNSMILMHPYELSGGMLQRLNFVLALAINPQLIILDEPTSAIDSVNSLLSLKAIKNFVSRKNNSALIVTQDILFAQKVSDKIAFLSEGTLTDFIEVNELMNSNNSCINSFLNAYKKLSK
ncbi:MAG: ATP-binding cassette domain-containing protein [Ignavibacteriaceae bacterium]|nr:ATP-binding cassette domain-containing protein [Ignavibacteriaceae bacterium]